jgi:hypothetical protein
MEKDRLEYDEPSVLETRGFWISIKFQFSTELFYEWANDLFSGLVMLLKDLLEVNRLHR